MRTHFGWLGLILAAFVVCPAIGADGKKAVEKPDAEKKEENPQPKETFLLIRQVSGTITHLQNRNATVQVVTKNMVPNQAAQQKYIQLEQQLQRYMMQRTANPTTIQNLFNQMLEQKANFFKLEEKKENVEVVIHDDVKVRVEEPPVEIDENGRIKKWTVAELKEKRGADNLWGFPGEFEQLAVGQAITVFITKKKQDKKEGGEVADDNQPSVTTIYIYAKAKQAQPDGIRPQR